MKKRKKKTSLTSVKVKGLAFLNAVAALITIAAFALQIIAYFSGK